MIDSTDPESGKWLISNFAVSATSDNLCVSVESLGGAAVRASPVELLLLLPLHTVFAAAPYYGKRVASRSELIAGTLALLTTILRWPAVCQLIPYVWDVL